MSVRATASPYRLDGGGGEHLRFGEVEVLIKASAESTGGAFTIFEENEPVDTGLHVHESEDELFYVLEGEHVIQVGDEEFRVGPGDIVFAPRGVPHAQRRVMPRAGRLLVLTSPAVFERSSAASLPPRARVPSARRPMRVPLGTTA